MAILASYAAVLSNATVHSAARFAAEQDELVLFGLAYAGSFCSASMRVNSLFTIAWT